MTVVANQLGEFLYQVIGNEHWWHWSIPENVETTLEVETILKNTFGSGNNFEKHLNVT